MLILSSCKNEVQKQIVKEKDTVKEINFYTSDSIKIFGDLYELDKDNTTILLFHQGGSNARGEYVSIIPKLIEKGFNVLAIDQRVGGQIYGNYNRTIANIPDNTFDSGYTYCDAYSNLEGALDYIKKSDFSGKKVIWGSSYSAALAIQLASKRQSDIDGVLAFSPSTGNAVKECHSDKYLETINIPLLILRPPHEMEREGSKIQFELAEKYNHQTYVSKYGVHGSSMLVESRVENSVDETWKVVLSFLDKL